MLAETDFGSFEQRDWRSETETDEIRFAVIGVGGYARNYILPAIRDSDYCNVTTLVSGNPEKARTVGEAFDVGRIVTYDQFHDGVGVEDYDAIYVATPPARHLPFVESAAAFDKHVLCEKPLEVNAKRAERLVTACDDAEVRLMVAYRLQTDPVMRGVRDLIIDGHIGDVTQIHGDFAYSILDVRSRDHWRMDPDLSGGGVLMDVGIYPINMSRFFLGVDPIATLAMASYRDTGSENVDEHVAFQLAFPNGITASLTASHDSHRLTRIQLLGTAGRVSIEPAFGIAKETDVLVEAGDARLEIAPPFVNEIVEQCDYFATKVDSDTRIEPDGWGGVVDLQTVESVYESANTGSRVEIPSPDLPR